MDAKRQSFVNALCAAQADSEHADKLSLYGQFVGAWEAEARAFRPDGSVRRHFWHVHFSWVLEGRAIQDVWITPPRHGPRVGRSEPWGDFGDQYGTTLRLYDPPSDSWNVMWVDPRTGYRAHLTGRRRGEEIFQEGSGSDGRRLRWIFSEIRPDSFRWRAELSADGVAWHKAIDLIARRV